jgi:hypothetical protein
MKNIRRTMTKEKIFQIIKCKVNSIETIEEYLMHYIKILVSNYLVDKYYGNIKRWKIVLGKKYIEKFTKRYFSYLIFKLR